MRRLVLATLAGLLLLGAWMLTDIVPASRQEACLARCTRRVTAATQYPETVASRCARLCSEVHP